MSYELSPVRACPLIYMGENECVSGLNMPTILGTWSNRELGI